MKIRHLALPLLLALVSLGCSSDDPVAVDGSPPDAGKDAGNDAAVDVVTPDVAEPDAASDLAADVTKPDPYWSEIGGTVPQRYGHRAVLLDDGRVLIAGGYQALEGNVEEFIAQTYLYEPDNDLFVDAGELQVPRYDHTATLLPDGRVLVTGGQSAEAYEQSTELFDPTAAPAAAWSTGPPLFKVRWGHEAVGLKDGKVLVTGGFGTGSSLTATIFDPQTDSWSPLGATMNDARSYHTMTLLDSGSVLIAGGVEENTGPGDDVFHDTLELYEPQTGTFTALAAKMSRQRSGHQAVMMNDGRVMITGGYCTGFAADACGDHLPLHDIYDPSLDAIVAVGHPSTVYPASGHGTACLPDGRVMLFSFEELMVLAYDSGPGTWSTLPDMLTAVKWPSATRLADGSVLVAGGITNPGEWPPIFATTAQRFFP